MNFTSQQSKTIVITATAGAAILSSLEQLASKQAPSVRIGVGAVIAGAVLYSLTDVAPALAGSLALLLLVGAALTNGVKVANIVATATK